MIARHTRPRVFISYAHDTVEHVTQVMKLCHVLRDQGVDARLDNQDVHERQDWYAWYVEQIRHADFVLVIASPNYRAAGDGQGAAHRSRGVRCEAALLRDLLHADRPAWTRKILPVVLPGGSIDEIPLFLQPYLGTHYVVGRISAGGIEDLLRTITGQPAYPPSPVRNIPILPPRRVFPETVPGERRHSAYVHASGRARVYQAGRDQYINEP